MTDETGVPVIDDVVAGLKLVEGIVGCGLGTSKVGAQWFDADGWFPSVG